MRRIKRLAGHKGLRLAMLMLAAPAIISCASMLPTNAGQTEWRLSPSAEASYNYLVYLDAARAGKAQQADGALSKVLELDKRQEVYLELADLKWRLGKTEEAAVLLQDGLVRYPGDKWLTLRLADIYRLQQRYDGAATTLETYLAAHPSDAEALSRQARLALERERFAQARDILAKLPAERHSPEVLYLRAKAEVGLAQNRKAIATLRKALEKDPTYLPAVVELAYILELENDFAEAERVYVRLLELGEASTEVWIKLIDLNLKLNNPEKALSLAQSGPQSKAFLLETAHLFLGQKFYDEATEVLTPLAQQEPMDADVRFYLALLEYEGRKNSEAALYQLTQIPQDSPHHQRSLSFRAQILISQKRSEQALVVLQEARELYPAEAEFAEVQAWALATSNRNAEAEQVLVQALTRWPDNADILYRLGLIQEEQGRSSEALLSMERVITIAPDKADALNFIGYVLAEQGRDLQRALTLIRKAMELDPDNGYILDSLAWVLFKLGEYDKSMLEIRKAVSMEKNDSAIWEHFGDIARALNKRKEARKGYSNALKLGSKHTERVQKKLEGL
ncbi:tetratricopeptide repeat protein [Desulfocurvibacter africanus]|uniref:tetratricopeptide repeat protein n=1 Tax=Desulfocurvibacter africanus TaxID=873 RepID=UPI0003F9574C|nr:tetratricopeptide repeat protein [Desulfocurvibacter africanus]